MITAYNIIFYLLAVPLLPIAALIVALSPKMRESLDERAGFMKRDVVEKLNGKRTVWFHAASVGEVQALTPIIREFKVMRPDLKIMVTTTSANGRKKIAKELAAEIDHSCLLPMDVSFIIGGFVRMIDPFAVVIVETELWPNFLHAVRAQKAPLIMVNGRISIKSFRLYYPMRFFFAGILDCFDLLIVQSEKMQKRVSRIGVKKAKIIIMNNTKFSSEIDAQGLKNASIPDKKGKIVVVAGSIREGEEEMVIDGWRMSGPGSVLVIAPRRLNRVKLIEGILKQRGCTYALWSALRQYPRIPEFDAIIVDTIGDLSFIYNCGDAAIIGGGFMKYGGHNPMEAAVAGLPVIFGRNMFNFEDTAGLFVKEGGAWAVNSAQELSERLSYLKQNPGERARLGGMNRKIIEKFRGSAGTTAMLVNEVLIDQPQAKGQKSKLKSGT